MRGSKPAGFSAFYTVCLSVCGEGPGKATHNGTHRTRVRAHDEARLEAGWVQCMRHASSWKAGEREGYRKLLPPILYIAPTSY